jgi:uncharacterized protein RhaS with RHS repeats
MSDPYDCTRPTGWTANADGDAVAYTDPAGTRRVTITEVSRGLSLFWWVDAARRPTPSADWEPVATTAGDSFRDHEAAVRAAERVVARFAAAASERADERPEQATESVDARDEAVADGG